MAIDLHFLYLQDSALGEFQLLNGRDVPFCIEVRPEAFQNGLPIPVLSGLLYH